MAAGINGAESMLTHEQEKVVAEVASKNAFVKSSSRQNIVGNLMLFIGLIAVASSWLSIRPSSNYRYQKMLVRYDADPELVSALEWVQSKDDEGFTALSLLIIGVPAFLLVTGLTIVTCKFLRASTSPKIPLGSLWLLLGGLLHGMLWTQ